MLPSSQFRDVTLKDYLVVLRRRVWIILASFFIVTLFSTLKSLEKIPLYQATAKILIERSIPQVAPVQQVYTPGWADKEYTQSQINIMTSRSLAKEVVENLIASGDRNFMGMEQPENKFISGVTVSLIPGTQLVNVGYISSDPVKAAKFANTLVHVYIQQDIEKRVDASKYATGWLDQQLTDLKARLIKSEASLNDYLQKNQIISFPDIESKTEGTLEALKQDKIRFENEIEELSKRYKDKHPKMMNLRTRLGAITRSVEDETQKLLELNRKKIQYNAIKRDWESSRSLYESFLKRVKETEVSRELQTTNIRIVDLADVPQAPFSPNRKRDITTGALLGFILGLILAFFFEYIDSTVKTTEDVELYLRLPFLGYVSSARREAKTQKEIDLISHKLPHSRIAEAYRSIRTSLIFSAPEDKPLKTILITSSSPEEGKTTVSLNMGIIFANADERTLILEADMRRPRITTSLDLDNDVGLSSFLTGTSELSKVVKKTAINNLYVIPSGPRPPNPAELLTTNRIRILLDELKNVFDRIIIDSPPVMTVTDTSILANIADGVIDVIRAGFQNIDIILKGRQRLYEAKARIIGVILNNVDVKKEDSYYYYHYYYPTSEDQDKKDKKEKTA